MKTSNRRGGAARDLAAALLAALFAIPIALTLYSSIRSGDGQGFDLDNYRSVYA